MSTVGFRKEASELMSWAYPAVIYDVLELNEPIYGASF